MPGFGANIPNWGVKIHRPGAPNLYSGRVLLQDFSLTSCIVNNRHAPIESDTTDDKTIMHLAIFTCRAVFA